MQAVLTDELTSALYWSRRTWNGRRCVPVVLELAGGRLRMVDPEGDVFRAPVRRVRARATGRGALVVDIDGHRFCLSGRGSRVCPPFTDAQRALLDAGDVSDADLLRDARNNLLQWCELLAAPTSEPVAAAA